MTGIAQVLLASSSILELNTVTTGATGGVNAHIRGFSGIYAVGSISPTTTSIYGGAFINELRWDEGGGGGADYIELLVTGVQVNSGWTSITIGNLTLLRSAASFSTATNSSWDWLNLGLTTVTQPFGANLSTCPIVFR